MHLVLRVYVFQYKDKYTIKSTYQVFFYTVMIFIKVFIVIFGLSDHFSDISLHCFREGCYKNYTLKDGA